MEDKKILLDNIDKIHTTEMGADRIRKNLKIDTEDVVGYCKNKVIDKNCNINKQMPNCIFHRLIFLFEYDMVGTIKSNRAGIIKE